MGVAPLQLGDYRAADITGSAGNEESASILPGRTCGAASVMQSKTSAISAATMHEPNTQRAGSNTAQSARIAAHKYAPAFVTSTRDSLGIAVRTPLTAR